MKNLDRNYLQSVVDSFIIAGINRAAHSGDLVHHFRLGADELKESTDRQRLHDAVRDGVLSFFAGAHIQATYDASRATFDITLDLCRCALNHAQSVALSVAMESFRAEHA